MISILLLSLVFLFGVLPVSPPSTGFPIDKLFHGIAFFWIGFYAPNRKWKGLGGLLAAGMLLEVLQSFLPYRSFEWADFVSDSVGIILGIGWPSFYRRGMERLVLHLGVGQIPWAPATWGSLLAIALYALLPLSYPAMVGALAFGGVVGWYAYLNQRDQEDPPWVVLDEALAVWTFLPLLPKNWMIWGLFFILFRAIDILKPLGIRRLEDLPGGILWDDMAAAFVAFGLVLIGYWFFNVTIGS